MSSILLLILNITLSSSRQLNTFVFLARDETSSSGVSSSCGGVNLHDVSVVARPLIPLGLVRGSGTGRLTKDNKRKNHQKSEHG